MVRCARWSGIVENVVRWMDGRKMWWSIVRGVMGRFVERVR